MARVKIGPYHAWPLSIINVSLVIVLSLTAYIVRCKAFNHLSASDSSVKFQDVVVPAIQLVPSKFFMYPWTLLTEPFVETSIIRFILSIVIVFVGTEYLESNWNLQQAAGLQITGSSSSILDETSYYLVIVTLATDLACVIIKSATAVFGLSSTSMLAKPLNMGMFAIFMSFIVVVKQLSPESNVKVFSVIKFRLKRLPFILLSFALFVSVLRLSITPFLTPLFINFYISWFYLRYYQINHVADILPTATNSGSSTSSGSSTVRGDASDTFAFVQFFPDRWHSYLRPVSRFFYHSSVFLGVFKPFNDDDIESSNLRTIQRLNKGTRSNGSSSNSDTDRRKRIALKVLEQKVGQTSSDAKPSQSAPVDQKANAKAETDSK